MNERIEELAEKATQEFSSAFERDKWLEKFAELNVQECAAYMYEHYPHSRYEINYMRKHMGDKDWNKPIGGVEE
jgi:hypothetical protein